MAQSIGQASRFEFLQGSSLIFLSLLVSLALSNHAESAASGILVFVVPFFFPGYLLLTLSSSLQGSIRILLSPTFGIVTVTTAHDIFARSSIAAYLPCLIAALSVAGMVLFVQQSRQLRTLTHWTPKGACGHRGRDRGWQGGGCPEQSKSRQESAAPTSRSRPDRVAPESTSCAPGSLCLRNWPIR